MPVIGLGTWMLTDDTAGTVAHAIHLGYRMIDTSGDYGTEAGVGAGVRRGGVDRERLYVVSKVEEHEDGYESTLDALQQLGFDYLDLMLIHRPPPTSAGQQLWEALLRAKHDGLARDIGVSNYSAGQILELVGDVGEMPVVNQIEWSPFGWDQDMLDFCTDHGVVIQAYSPLTRAKRLEDERLIELASRYDRSPAQLMLRWHLQIGVAPLPKANRRDHLEENTAIFDFEIDEEDMRCLGRLNEQYSSLGSLPYI